MSDSALHTGPRWWMIPACIAGMALGAWLLLAPPDPFADLVPGARLNRTIVFFRAGGGVLLLAAVYRLFALRWVAVTEEGLRVSSLLRRRLFRWERFVEIQDDPLQYRIRFVGGDKIELQRWQYAPAAIAALDAEVRRRTGP